MANFFRGILISVVVLGFGQACTPAPRHLLTAEEKQIDVDWLANTFRGEYAPLQFKETFQNFQFEVLHQNTRDQAAKTQTNAEFYALLHQFVGQFKDAHTSGTLVPAGFEGRAEVAYLGFETKRDGNNALVTSLYPTIDAANTKFPIHVGDEILKADGMKIADYVQKYLVPYRDLGQNESNLTYHMSKLFYRTDTMFPMPDQDNITLTVQRPGITKPLELTLPWIIRDYHTFTEEQVQAKHAQTTSQPHSSDSDDAIFQVASLALSGSIGGEFGIAPMIRKLTPGFSDFNFSDGFVFRDNFPTVGSAQLERDLSEWAKELKLKGSEKLLSDDAETRLQAARKIPDNALMLGEAKIFPSYITSTDQLDKSGKKTGQSVEVGYIWVNTFEAEAGDEAAVAEFSNTLKLMQKNGITNLVIDLIDNGGGSLGLSLRMAQLLSRNKVAMPDIQVMLNETWLDQFEQESVSGSSDAEKEWARRVFVKLKADWDTNHLRVSRRLSSEELVPFELMPNSDLDTDFKIVLLTNEMCASACDVFSSIVQDDGIGKVVGSKTMGAGGNVVNERDSAPNSKMSLSQTQSLVLRKDGSYLENNGVVPDQAMDVSSTIGDHYDPVLQKALAYLATTHAE